MLMVNKKMFVLNALLFISIYSVIKFSELPLLVELPIINFIFLKPEVNTEAYEIFRLFENLGLAYISSYVFYILIEYLPNKKMEKKAFELIKSDLINLYMNMSNIIAFLNCKLLITKDIKDIQLDDILSINELCLENKKEYYSQEIYINGIVISHDDLYINVHNYINSSIKNIQDNIDKIKGISCSSYIETEIIEVLSEIESGNFLNSLLYTLKKPPINAKIYHTSLNKDYIRFINSYKLLSNFNFDKYSYKLINMNDDEIQAYEDSVKRNLKEKNIDRDKLIKNGTVFCGGKRL